MIATCIVQVVIAHFFHMEVLEGKVRKVIGNHLVVDFTQSAAKIEGIEGNFSNFVVLKNNCEVIKDLK